jgi:hypothetical protein
MHLGKSGGRPTRESCWSPVDLAPSLLLPDLFQGLRGAEFLGLLQFLFACHAFPPLFGLPPWALHTRNEKGRLAMQAAPIIHPRKLSE